VVCFALAILFAQGLNQRIDSYLASKVKAGLSPGISVSVVRDGSIVYAGGAGLANIKANRKAGPDTCFRTMSVGKQFTAAGVLLLVQKGLVSLDKRVSDYVRDLPQPWAKVKVRDLLDHSSGIPNYTELPGFAKQLGKDVDPVDLLRPVYRMPLKFVPGTSSAYSNSDFFVLGMIIQKVSHQTLGTYLSRNVFLPMGMRHTHLEMPLEGGPNRAVGYMKLETGFSETPYVSPNVIWAAGGFVSSARDMATWDIALHKRKLLTSGLVAKMEAPARPGGDFGLGSEIGTYHGQLTAGHQGSGIGFNTDYFVIPKYHLSIIVLCNSTRGPSEEIAKHIVGLCIPALSDEGKTAIVDPDPRITTRVRHILENAAAGIAEPADFSPAVDKGFLEFLKRGGPKMLGPMGKIQELDLIALTPHMRRYRVRYEKQRLEWEFKFDEKGLVASMEPTKE